MELENPHLKISQLNVVQPLEFLRSLGAAEVPQKPLINGDREKEGGSREYFLSEWVGPGQSCPQNLL